MVLGVHGLLSDGGATPPPNDRGIDRGSNAVAVPRAGGIISSAVGNLSISAHGYSNFFGKMNSYV